MILLHSPPQTRGGVPAVCAGFGKARRYGRGYDTAASRGLMDSRTGGASGKYGELTIEVRYYGLALPMCRASLSMWL